MSQQTSSIWGLGIVEDEELSSVNYPIYTPGGVFGTVAPNQQIYNSVQVETGETVEYVGFFNQIQNGSPKTLKSLFDTTVNIQSASGKITKVILILQARFTNPDINIRSSAGIDTANGTVIKTLNNNNWSANSYLTVDDMELLSNGFLTIEVTNVGGNIDVEGGIIVRQA